ncbi:hypothetical protein ACIA48_02610 [Mycobacterium sp. NPDC051804]|uniref:hypothetical protein n=1 Tax=Mycobacterium sp. NPDC051804 TaxID=3364295 RepID=UPI0037BBAFE1
MRPTRTAALAATLLIAAGVSAGHVSAQPSSEEPAPPTNPTEQAQPGPDGQPTAEAAPPGPKTTIDGDGTYAVGKDIVPGNYASAGPLPGGSACYWKRSSGDELVDNALTKKAQVVQISAGDTAFTTTACQPWTLTNAPVPAQGSATQILGDLGKLILTNPSGPPPSRSAPAAEGPADEAPAAETPAAETPTEHIPSTGTAPGPG